MCWSSISSPQSWVPKLLQSWLLNIHFLPSCLFNPYAYMTLNRLCSNGSHWGPTRSPLTTYCTCSCLSAFQTPGTQEHPQSSWVSDTKKRPIIKPAQDTNQGNKAFENNFNGNYLGFCYCIRCPCLNQFTLFGGLFSWFFSRPWTLHVKAAVCVSDMF